MNQLYFLLCLQKYYYLSKYFTLETFSLVREWDENGKRKSPTIFFDCLMLVVSLVVILIDTVTLRTTFAQAEQKQETSLYKLCFVGLF